MLRHKQFEEKLVSMKVPETARDLFYANASKLETDYLRKRRQKLTGNSFEVIRIIGKGAFGEVLLVRKKTPPYHVLAMKRLNKQKMMEKHQATHVLAEKDALAAANKVYKNNPWIVKLYYSFQVIILLSFLSFLCTCMCG